MNYRVRVESGEPAANGDIHLDCWIEKEKEDEPGVWELVPMGHRTLVLDGAAVLSITESDMSDAEKRAALLNLFRHEAESWGIHEADDAYSQLCGLLPDGWPVTVNLA